MRISRNFELYSLNEKATISECLNLLEKNGGYPISIINKKNIFLGIVTNTSIREAYLKEISANNFCTDVMQTNCITARDIDNKETIAGFFTNKNKIEYKLIPLLTNECLLHSFALDLPPLFDLGSKLITKDNEEILLIAEIGVNHNGSLESAISLVDAAKQAGFDAIKLQCRSSKTYNDDELAEQELSVQYIKSELDKNNLDYNIEKKLINYIKKTNLKLILTPFDEDALKRVLVYEPDAIKIASADTNNFPLLEKVAQTKLPVILSTGMCFESEIIELIQWCKEKLNNYAILHCNSTYPTPPNDVNLTYIRRLSKLAPCVVGYSSHDYDYLIPSISICYGARIIETHITQDKNLPGTDHLASIETRDLRNYVEQIKKIILVNGVSLPRTPSQGELANKLVLGKSLCFKSSMEKGDIFTIDNFELRSPGDGILYKDLKYFLDKKIALNVKAGSQAKLKHFVSDEKKSIEKKIFDNLNELRWGLPARFRDLKELIAVCDPRIVEFHLSSNDINYDYESLLSSMNLSKKELVIHAIEQYSDGFILNLCSSDQSEREESVERVRKVVELSQRSSKFFPEMKNKKIPIVINIGGFSRDSFLSNNERNKLIDHGCRSLEELILKNENIEFIPQSMPPFPWFQGGCAFHNVLCSAEDIKLLKERLGLNITMDVSHTALYCNYKKIDIIEYLSEILPNISHLHLADASQNGDEGLQLGFGDIPLIKIINLLKRNKMLSTPSIVLEIWQGHLNSFNGFIDGLEILSSLIELSNQNEK